MMERICCVWIIFLFHGFTFSVSQARPSSASTHHATTVVTGTALCDSCFHHGFSKGTHFISGAVVAVECGDSRKRSSFYKVVKSNEHGEFSVELPLLVQRIKGCRVKLISSSDPHCAVASRATSPSLRLKSRKQGPNIYSAGFLTFKPTNPCKRKSRVHIHNKNDAEKSLTLIPKAIEDPIFPGFVTRKDSLLPPFPTLPPLPQLPPLPPLPIFPPIFPTPTLSPPPTFRLPPIPGLTPILPPPPALPFPLPPFPFRPIPGFPGVPPPTPSSMNVSP